ncbi:MAG: hypothetical protein WKI04_10490 [Ferruginibacter sp.]
MIKGIPRTNHGLLDYIYVAFALGAPSVAGFRNNKKESNFCWAAGSIVLGYTLVTNAEWGVVKIVPYKTHLLLDIGVGIGMLTAGCSLKKPEAKVRKIFLFMGLTGIVVGALSLIGNRKI